MTNFKNLSITLCVTSLISTAVFANTETTLLKKVELPMPSFSQLVSEYDADQNETLSPKEVVRSSKLTELFSDIDSNKDKQISNDEYSEYIQSTKKSIS